MRYPLLGVLLGMLAGIAAVVWLEVAPWGLWLAVALLGIGAALWRRYRWSALLVVTGIALGTATMLWHKPRECQTAQAIAMQGTVRRVSTGGDIRRFIFEISAPDSLRGAKIYVTQYAQAQEKLTPQVGDILALRARLLPATTLDTGVPEEWSPQEYLYYNGVVTVADISEPQDIRLVGRSEAPWALLHRWRADIEYRLRHSGLGGRCCDLLEALLLGDTSSLSPQLRQRFAQAGLSHIVALSGTHVAVLAFLISLLFLPLRLWRRSAFGRWATVLILWGYVALVGAPPSVVRAVVMATCVVATMNTGAMAQPVSGLLLAAFVILLFDPLAMLQPGFQMSFAAVATLVMFVFRVSAHPWRHPILRRLLTAVAVCVVAVMGTAPLAAWHFHQFPVYFLLANLPAIFLVPLLMIGGAVLLLVSLAGGVAPWLVTVLDFLYHLLTTLSQWVSDLPGATIIDIHFPWWLLLLYYGALLAAYRALRQTSTRRRYLWSCAAGSLLTAAVCLGLLYTPSYPRVEVFDISAIAACRHSEPDDDPATPPKVILCRFGSEAVLLTDLPATRVADITSRVWHRYRDYLTSRGVSLLRVNPDSLASPRAFRRPGLTLRHPPLSSKK